MRPCDQTDAGKAGIRYGLAGIKGVGVAAAESIVAERRKDGPFKSLHDFLSRLDVSVNKKALESLARCGALDSFGYHRAALLDALPRAMARAASEREDRARGQASLFELFAAAAPAGEDGGVDAEERAERDSANRAVAPMSRLEELLGEKELLGLYLSGHPLERYRNIASGFKTFSAAVSDLAKLAEDLAPRRSRFRELPLRPPEPTAFPDGDRDPGFLRASEEFRSQSEELRRLRHAMRAPTRFCAFVSAVERVTDRNGNPWCRLTLEDAVSKQQFPVFAGEYGKLLRLGKPDQREPPELNRAYLFEAVLEPSFRLDAHLSLVDFVPVEEVPRARAERVVAALSGDRLDPLFQAKVRDLFDRYAGSVPAGVQLRLPDGARVLVSLPRGRGVDPSPEFLSEAEELLGLRNVFFKMREEAK